jgi:esterase
MKLFYRKSGEGPPLFILHGLFGSSDNWVTIGKALSSYYTVYLPDLRNHGQSPHSDVHDYESMSNDLKELADDLKIKRFFLAGHSMGGKVAMAFVKKWPEMINGLLIADISPFKNNNWLTDYKGNLSVLKSMLQLDLANVKSRDDAELLLKTMGMAERERGFVLKNIQRSENNTFTWKINLKALFENLDKIVEGIDITEESDYQVTGFPVIFLRGELSEYLPEKEFPDILKIYPGAELVTLKKAGHWVHTDQPEGVIELIKNLQNFS